MTAAVFDQVTVIVRHCGERTTDACAQLLAGLAPDATIHRVTARPFHETLRQSLILGVEEGRPWTLCVDADVLVLPEIADFLRAARGLPATVFEAQALVLDKLLLCRRPAGNHLYRTELIAQALPLIPESRSLRPESDMILAMAERGFPAHQSARLVGLHDFEQSFADLYAKAYLHGFKHRYLQQLFQPLWQALAASDDDYRVALAALEQALNDEAMPAVSRDATEAGARAALARLALAEKPGLSRLDSAPDPAFPWARLDPGHEALRRSIQAQVDGALFPQHEDAAPGPAPSPFLVRALRAGWRILRRMR